MPEKDDETKPPISGAPTADAPAGIMGPADAVNPPTAAEIAPRPAWVAPPAVLPYVAVAERELGVRELPGKRQEARIVAYHATTTLKATDDETPWCSSFINWCMQKAQMEGTNSAAAVSWAKWGEPLEKPVPGCLVVMKRTGGHHVAIFRKKISETIWLLLGGNQGDSVSEARFSIDPKTIVGLRWPLGVPVEPYLLEGGSKTEAAETATAAAPVKMS